MKTMDDVQFDRYRERVAYFRDADLSDRQVQREIAREQRSRLFEWACSRVVPATLWYDASRALQRSVQRRPPENLGEAASWILEVTTRTQPEPATVKSDEDTAIGGEPRAALLDRARRFYHYLDQEQTQTVGGVSALVSCSIERYRRSDSQGSVQLVPLEDLPLRIVQPGARKNDLLDALLSGEVEIEEAVGVPKRKVE